MSRRVLVVAAHPDDEILGCGATMAKHVQMGDEVHVVILAEGITSRDKHRDRGKHVGELAELNEIAQRANQIIGTTSLTLYDFPDNRLDSVDILDLVKVVETLIDRYRPEIVFSHHAGDLNIDHRRVHDAVAVACRPILGQPVKSILLFEVASSTEWQLPDNSKPHFAPNWFVDISDTLDLKLRALGAYQSEMREWPHSRSISAIQHLARWRGASVGMDAAEAFVLGRNLID